MTFLREASVGVVRWVGANPWGGRASAARGGRAVETKKTKGRRVHPSTTGGAAPQSEFWGEGMSACLQPGRERKRSEFPPPGALHYHSHWSLPQAYKGRQYPVTRCESLL